MPTARPSDATRRPMSAKPDHSQRGACELAAPEPDVRLAWVFPLFPHDVIVGDGNHPREGDHLPQDELGDRLRVPPRRVDDDDARRGRRVEVDVVQRCPADCGEPQACGQLEQLIEQEVGLDDQRRRPLGSDALPQLRRIVKRPRISPRLVRDSAELLERCEAGCRERRQHDCVDAAQLAITGEAQRCTFQRGDRSLRAHVGLAHMAAHAMCDVVGRGRPSEFKRCLG